MEYGHIAHVDKPISRMVFGTAMPTMFAAFRSVYGESPDFDARLDAAFRLLDDMYAEGVNCFDCADHYGEEPLGEWLQARGLRDQVVILTKGAHHNRWRRRVTDFDILHDVHNSLAKLKTDHLDLYLLHRDDPETPVSEIMETLYEAKREEKIRLFGVSNWTVDRIREGNRYALKNRIEDFSVSSPNYGLALQMEDLWGGGCVSIAGPEHREDREWYAATHMPVVAYSSLGRGFFSGKFRSDDPEGARRVLDSYAQKGYLYPENLQRLKRAEEMAQRKGLTVPEIAMRYVFASPMNLFAVVSTTNPERLDMHIEAAANPLTAAEAKWLEEGDTQDV